MKTNHFEAPWGRPLKAVSVLVTALLAGTACFGFFANLPPVVRWLMLLTPLAVLAGCALSAIRGYAVEKGELLIERPWGKTRVPLEGLVSAAPEADAMRHSLRLCGNGGAFSFTGWFRNKSLGTYRAFVTDPNRCVVLRFADRTVVVSPDRPEDFAKMLRGSAAGRR